MPWQWLLSLVVVDNVALAHVHTSARPRVTSASFGRLADSEPVTRVNRVTSIGLGCADPSAGLRRLFA